jgi:cytoskeletal protein CcmA (bactofilin family)
MAISSFGKSKSGSQRAAVATPAATPPTSGNLTAFIDQGSEFEGKLNFKDTVRIDGRFRGEITSENTLLVGESGEIEATIDSQSVVVCGVVSGNINAGRQVVLHKGARMDGDISTPSIVIEEGAIFNGQLSMKVEGAAKIIAPVKDLRDASKQANSAPASKEGVSPTRS